MPREKQHKMSDDADGGGGGGEGAGERICPWCALTGCITLADILESGARMESLG